MEKTYLKMKRLIIRILNLDVKEAIRNSDIERKNIAKRIQQVRETLDGEDRWFIKVCDSDDPNEKNCPMDLNNNVE